MSTSSSSLTNTHRRYSPPAAYRAPEAESPPSASGATHSWGDLSPDEKQALVIPLIKQGKSYSEVAAILKAPSRNAVSRVVWRARHHSGVDVKSPRSPGENISIKANRKRGGITGGKPGKALREARRKARDIQRGEPRAAEDRPAPVSKPEAPLHGREGREAPAGTAAPLMLSLMDLTPGTCRWPVDGEKDRTRFCGAAPRAKSPYCQHHHERAYALAEDISA